MSEEKRSEDRRLHKYPDYFYNRITYMGVGLALFIFVIELFLFGLDFFSGGAHVYLGILTYVILPVFLIIGLLLIPAGALWKRRRVHKGISEKTPKTLFVDPANPKHRNAIFVFTVGTMVLLIMSAIGSYKAFHYTESVHFCGVMCHKVMKPQYTAYMNSSHARVKCVECHIGPGASWYVRSKLSGVRQIFATIGNTYERPIPTPVHNLRPAKETCEHCHWPGKFYSSVEMKKTYFGRQDEQNPTWNIHMLVNVGRDEKQNEGIHAHMYLDHEIYYVPDDERRQEISWVKSVEKDGSETIFVSPGSAYEDDAPPEEKIRKMDCMDCHNRPSHQYNAPRRLVNDAMVRETISTELPGIKQKAMNILSEDYASQKEAEELIPRKLREEYENVLADHPEWEEHVEKTADALVELFNNNFFPKMETRWDAYPNNIGHMISPGCFRCHDGQHAAPSGDTITKDCNVCHVIIAQGPPDALEKDVDGLPFKHPFEDYGLWKEMNCYDCHTGN